MNPFTLHCWVTFAKITHIHKMQHEMKYTVMRSIALNILKKVNRLLYDCQILVISVWSLGCFKCLQRPFLNIISVC